MLALILAIACLTDSDATVRLHDAVLDQDRGMASPRALDIDDSINAKCPFSGSPIIESSLGLYKGLVVGFCNPGCRDKFVSDPSAWPDAVAYFNTLITEMDEWHKPWAPIEKSLREKNVANVWQKPEVSIIVYAPKGKDNQAPHNRDEVYMVISGSGKFKRGDETVPFKAGDFLFVPKSMGHRFIDFTDDFRAWVVFYGERS